MKQNKSKKLLSMLLTLVLAIQLVVPISVFANNDSSSKKAEVLPKETKTNKDTTNEKETTKQKPVKIVNPKNANKESDFEWKEGKLVEKISEYDGKKYLDFDTNLKGEIQITNYKNKTNKNPIIPAYIQGKPVTSIGYQAFSVNLLTSVTIPNSVTMIGAEAFSINQLTSVTIPSSVTTIEREAFSNNNLTSVTIGDSVTSIGGGAFERNNLTSVTIPNSVTTIEYEAFSRNNLTSVTIPSSITTVEREAFSENKLKSVTLPDSIKDKDEVIANSFGRCYSRYNGTGEVEKANGYNVGDYRVLKYNNNKIAIIEYLGKTKSVTIPEKIDGGTVAAIGRAVFSSRDLTSVKIPNSVVAIGEWAFYINNLTSITIPNSATTIGFAAFSYNNLTSVKIPNSVVAIGEWAFKSNKLTSVTIGNSVTTIGENAFSDNKLASITIPNSTKEIKEGAFLGNKLTSVTLPDSIKNKDEVIADSFGGYYVDNMTGETGEEVNGYNIGNYRVLKYNDNKISIIEYLGKDKNLTIPKDIDKCSVTAIGDGAFFRSNLTAVTIPNSVTAIGPRAFYVNNLTSIKISNYVTNIGKEAFYNNNLTSVTLPSHTKYYGDGGFENPSFDENVTIKGGQKIPGGR